MKGRRKMRTDNRAEIRHYIGSTVDIFVHPDRIAGRRPVAEVVLNQH